MGVDVLMLFICKFTFQVFKTCGCAHCRTIFACCIKNYALEFLARNNTSK